MYTVTITYLIDGFPQKETIKDVVEIKSNYNKTTLILNEIEEIVFYYVTKVKSKLQMQKG